MLYYDFGNYEGFKERFGLRDCGNGEKSRRNKILLAYVKQRCLLHRAVKDIDCRWEINIPTMNVLWESLKTQFRHRCEDYSWGGCRWYIAGIAFWTKLFNRDEYDGLCEDGDTRAIRYVNAGNGRVFKMTAGKFIRKVCAECGIDQVWPEQVLVWFCEEFAGKWRAYATGRLPNYTLHVSDVGDLNAFKEIYSTKNQTGDFHSCMNNQGYHSFYVDAVKAKAAWLTDNDGYMVARCVIFTEVTDDNTGEVLRLAERQYSSDCNDLLKRVLVDKLIAAGEIDGYKRVGVDCHSSRSFVSNDGKDWSDRDFSIRCDLCYGDRLSYQDSFKWWNSDGYAYNYDSGGWDEELDTTDGILGGGNYDDWNDEYTSADLVTVYYHGRDYQCAEDNMDEFRYIEYGTGQYEYHHEDDITYCDDIDEYVLDEDAHYSAILDLTYYDEDEMERAEEAYKERHWTYSEYDEEYFEDSDDVVKFIRADGEETTICRDSLAKFDYEEVESGVFKELEEVAA